MAAVTCKFKISRKSEMGWGTEVELVPDYGQGRNKDWSEMTPAGMMRLTITNKSALEVLEKDAPVTITIEPDHEETERLRVMRAERKAAA